MPDIFLYAGATPKEDIILSDPTVLRPGNEVSISESANAVDSPSAVYTGVASVTEPLAATDTPSAGSVLPVTVSEAASTADSQTGGLLQSAATTETASASDDSDAGLAIGGTQSEPLSALDDQFANIVPPTPSQPQGNGRQIRPSQLRVIHFPPSSTKKSHAKPLSVHAKDAPKRAKRESKRAKPEPDYYQPIYTPAPEVRFERQITPRINPRFTEPRPGVGVGVMDALLATLAAMDVPDSKQESDTLVRTCHQAEDMLELVLLIDELTD